MYICVTKQIKECLFWHFSKAIDIYIYLSEGIARPLRPSPFHSCSTRAINHLIKKERLLDNNLINMNNYEYTKEDHRGHKLSICRCTI